MEISLSDRVLHPVSLGQCRPITLLLPVIEFNASSLSRVYVRFCCYTAVACPCEQEVLDDNPHVLGAIRWKGDLPFLFKVISISKALSIQAHPDKVRCKMPT